MMRSAIVITYNITHFVSKHRGIAGKWRETTGMIRNAFTTLRFYSFNDLQGQMKRYLYRSNNIPMAVFAWKSPNRKHKELGGR